MNEIHSSRVDTLFASAPVGMVALDEALRIVVVNAAFATLTGRAIEDHVGRSLGDLWPKGDERISRLCREVLATRRVCSNVDVEIDLRGPLEPSRLCLVSIAEITDRSDAAALTMALIDVDERRHREREIEKAKTRYQKLVHATAQLVWSTDPYGRMIEPVPEWEAFTGQTFDEAKNYGWLSIIHPDDREASLSQWKQAQAGGPLESEYRMRRHDGQWRNIVSRAVPIVDDRGTIVEWIGANTDVTDRKSAERALRDKEADLRVITESVPVRIAYIDKDERYQFVNAAFAEFEGAPDTIIGRTIHEVHGAKSYAFFKPYRDVVFTGKTVHFEATREHGHDERNIAFSFVPRFGSNEEVTGFYSISIDVTEERKLQEQLHHAQKMEAVGRLAGGVAHDFNNLLTVILSYASLLEDRFTRDETSLRDIREIRHASELAAGLTRRLLAFARRDVFHAQIVDVNTVITNVQGLLVRVLGEHVTLSVKLGRELPKIKVDLGQLEQVLVNLAVNARDAMPDGGSLSLESTCASVTEDEAESIEGATVGTHVVLRVTDTGVGMTKDVEERIFEPFFTTKSAGRGTGLGLATCYGIVRHAGGHIRVDSEVGVGTSFEVWLPRADGEASPEAEATRATKIKGKEVVLFVEDEPRIRKLVVRAAREHGYEVLEAENGNDALRTIEAHEGKIQLLVTDVVMPEMGGRELAKRVKERWPDIEIIFTSGYAEGTFFEEIASRSDVHFVAKPYLVEELLDNVRRVLDAPPRP